MSYRIGSFNIRDFNITNTQSDERDFDLIAEIIVKEQFDVVAIQEVNAERAIKHLEAKLNQRKNFLQEWKSDYSGKAATTINDPEGYGFIWNAKRLRLLDFTWENSPYDFEKKSEKSIPSFRQNIYSPFTTSLRSPQNNPLYYEKEGADSLLRLPYYGRFTARGLLGGSNFELRLVNIHIAASRKDGIDEFNNLVCQVLPRICDLPGISKRGEVMPSYTFLLGDYNLSLNGSMQSVYRIETLTETNFTGKCRYYKTAQEAPTSLRHPNAQTTIEECYANNYDHFTYEVDLERKLILIPQRVDALTKYIKTGNTPSEKLDEYRKGVSDHVPIKLTIDLK